MDLKRLFDQIKDDYSVRLSKKLTVGTDCSGIEAPLMALDLLNIQYMHVFSSEIDKNCIDFINRNFKPVHHYLDKL